MRSKVFNAKELPGGRKEKKGKREEGVNSFMSRLCSDCYLLGSGRLIFSSFSCSIIFCLLFLKGTQLQIGALFFLDELSSKVSKLLVNVWLFFHVFLKLQTLQKRGMTPSYFSMDGVSLCLSGCPTTELREYWVGAFEKFWTLSGVRKEKSSLRICFELWS